MTPTQDPQITTAVAIGRLEEGQKHLLDGFKELNETVKRAITDNADLRREHAVTRRDVDDIQEWRRIVEPKIVDAHSAAETAKAQSARKPPWTAIVAAVVAVFSLGKQYLGF